MTVVFFDRQHIRAPYNGNPVSHQDDLRQLIKLAASDRPIICELVGASNKLLIGVSATDAFVQHSAKDGMPPYLMGFVDHGPLDKTACKEFFIGDIATPIPIKYLISIDLALEVASDFIACGNRSARISWEEI